MLPVIVSGSEPAADEDKNQNVNLSYISIYSPDTNGTS